jgi:hypothetical protein
MATYNGRRGPNVSQYIRDLNTMSPQESTGEEHFMEDGLALFTNTEFLDLDSGQNTDFHSQPVKVDVEPSTEDVTSATSVIGNMHNLDFMNGGEF